MRQTGDSEINFCLPIGKSSIDPYIRDFTKNRENCDLSEEIVVEEDVSIVDERLIVRKKNTKHYINGVDLHNGLVAYYDASDENPDTPIPQYIGECLLKIATNITTKYRFSSYTFKDEMISSSLEKMVEAVVQKKYDPSISQNPFAYFSQIAWNCCLQTIGKERREVYVRHKNLDRMAMFDELAYEDEDHRRIHDMINDDIHTGIINDFEAPKEKYKAVHRNLSYAANRAKKGRKKSDTQEVTDGQSIT